MEKWFLDFQADQTAKRQYMVKYETEDGTVYEDQLAGKDAQDVADYVRKINGDKTTIYFIAKLDNSWN